MAKRNKIGIITVNTHPVERIYAEDTRVKPQTLAHHKARYDLAIKLRLPQGKALDFGCGTGYGTEMLRQAGYEFSMGVDVHEETLIEAAKSYPKCVFSDFKLSTLDNEYDLVTMFEVIEHLTIPEAFEALSNIKRMLTKDGVFVLSTPRDINEKYNSFHKSKWWYSTLKDILSLYFSNVLIIGQDWDTAEFRLNNAEQEDFYIAICRN